MTKPILLATGKQLKRIALAVGGCAVLIGAGVAVITAGMMRTSLPAATITTQLPQATITVKATEYLPQATKTIKVPGATITKVAPRKELICPAGRSEDSCYPDYIGKGRWVLREGEPPAAKTSLPKAIKKVAKSKIASVCRDPRITRAMVADCNKLAARPAQVTEGFSNPKGAILVRECIDSYDNAEELGICLR